MGGGSEWSVSSWSPARLHTGALDEGGMRLCK